ncbi:MAG: glycosyltransferase family 4 protein [Anaerolineae bacterium]|nr:glycosyltransferase family 4 protein [Anaerolineae bacterium]
MKVIYSIGARLGGGGIGATAYHGVRGLQRHNMLQRLLCGSCRAVDIPRERIRALGLPSRALRKLAVYDGAKRIQRWHAELYDRWAAARLEPADLLLAWGGDGLLSIRRAQRLGMATVVEVASVHPAYRVALMHEEYARWDQTPRDWHGGLRRTRAEIELADYALIPSDFVRQTFLAQGIANEKLLQVPFGVDCARFRPAPEPPPQPFSVIYVGRLELGKGIPYLLEAWRRLGWRDAELVLVGALQPDYAPLFERQVRGLDSVRVIGHVADPVPYYQRAHLFAFPTLHEGSALTAYEAMACGLPLVTTPNAGSVARDGVEALLVPIRDAEALAAALERLRQDSSLYEAMRTAARARAEAYTWSASEDALAAALARLSKGRGSR